MQQGEAIAKAHFSPYLRRGGCLSAGWVRHSANQDCLLSPFLERGGGVGGVEWRSLLSEIRFDFGVLQTGLKVFNVQRQALPLGACPGAGSERGGEQQRAAADTANPRQAAAALPQLFSSLCRPRSDLHSWVVP